MLKLVIFELGCLDVTVYLARCSRYMLHLFEKSDIYEFFPRENVFVDLHDAVYAVISTEPTPEHKQKIHEQEHATRRPSSASISCVHLVRLYASPASISCVCLVRPCPRCPLTPLNMLTLLTPLSVSFVRPSPASPASRLVRPSPASPTSRLFVSSVSCDPVRLSRLSHASI